MGTTIDGNVYTRQEAWEEATRTCPNHSGLHINRDRRTFKVRVPTDKEEEGWAGDTRKGTTADEDLGDRKDSTGGAGGSNSEIDERYIIVGGGVARGNLRGKGITATSRVTVRANVGPALETVEILGAMFQVRELKPHEKEKESKTDTKDFFQNFKEADGAKKVLASKSGAQQTRAWAHTVTQAASTPATETNQQTTTETSDVHMGEGGPGDAASKPGKK